MFHVPHSQSLEHQSVYMNMHVADPTPVRCSNINLTYLPQVLAKPTVKLHEHNSRALNYEDAAYRKASFSWSCSILAISSCSFNWATSSGVLPSAFFSVSPAPLHKHHLMLLVVCPTARFSRCIPALVGQLWQSDVVYATSHAVHFHLLIVVLSEEKSDPYSLLHSNNTSATPVRHDTDQMAMNSYPHQ